MSAPRPWGAKHRLSVARRVRSRSIPLLGSAVLVALVASLMFGAVGGAACDPTPGPSGRLTLELGSTTPGAIVNRDGSLTCPPIRVLTSNGSRAGACQLTITTKGARKPQTVTVRASLRQASVEIERFTVASGRGATARFDQLPRALDSWSGRSMGSRWTDTFRLTWTNLTNRSMGGSATLVLSVEAQE